MQRCENEKNECENKKSQRNPPPTRSCPQRTPRRPLKHQSRDPFLSLSFAFPCSPPRLVSLLVFRTRSLPVISLSLSLSLVSFSSFLSSRYLSLCVSVNCREGSSGKHPPGDFRRKHCQHGDSPCWGCFRRTSPLGWLPRRALPASDRHRERSGTERARKEEQKAKGRKRERERDDTGRESPRGEQGKEKESERKRSRDWCFNGR